MLLEDQHDVLLAVRVEADLHRGPVAEMDLEAACVGRGHSRSVLHIKHRLAAKTQKCSELTMRSLIAQRPEPEARLVIPAAFAHGHQVARTRTETHQEHATVRIHAKQRENRLSAPSQTS